MTFDHGISRAQATKHTGQEGRLLGYPYPRLYTLITVAGVAFVWFELLEPVRLAVLAAKRLKHEFVRHQP